MKNKTMPFASEQQRRYCWYLYNKDLKEGRNRL